MKTIIEILVDNSNSMGNCEGLFENYKDYLLPDGSTRMELAKKILLLDILPTIDFASEITLSLFHSREHKEKDREIIQPIIYNGNNIDQLKDEVKGIEIPHKTGGTPITDAVINCIERLKRHPDSDRKLIMLTDGEETGEKDYKTATKEALELSGIKCNIFIIGISLKSEARKKAESLVKDTDGEYFHIESSGYERSTIQKKLVALRSALIVDTVNKLVENKELTETKEPSNEVKATDSKIDMLERNVNENRQLLNLISKQVSLIQSTITTQFIEEDADDENLIITENSEFNEKVRSASESFLFDSLKEKFGSRLEWMNADCESGESFDFRVIDNLDGSVEYYIECKGSSGDERVFFMTKAEWSLFLEKRNNYQLYFIANALSKPKVIKIDNLMDCILKEKVVPYPLRNRRLKAERILFTIVE